MSEPTNPRNLEPVDELNEIDDLQDVPTTVYTRTGKAAPTEVLPAAPRKDSADAKVVASEPIAVTDSHDLVDTASTPGSADYTDYTDPAAYSSSAATSGVADVAYEPAPHVEPAAPISQPAPLDRGTVDLGLLVLRLVLGAVLILQSLAIFFQLGNSEGLAGLEEQLAGHEYARILAIALPTMGLAAGVFLVLGLLTPVAAMVAVAATGFHVLENTPGGSPFMWGAEIWLAITLLGMALAVQFTGPGIFGVDYGRSWARRPVASSWICAALGLAGAGLLWWFA